MLHLIRESKPRMSDNTILQADHLTKSFGTGHAEVRAVDDVSMELHEGELALVMGPSGSGKTTLLSILGGLLSPSSGRVILEGTDITELGESRLPRVRARSVGFIFQSPFIHIPEETHKGGDPHTTRNKY